MSDDGKLRMECGADSLNLRLSKCNCCWALDVLYIACFGFRVVFWRGNILAESISRR